MFVQVIRGEVSDSSAVRAALEKWENELASGATGWLGSTIGMTDDGTLIAVARFDTVENARHSSQRPEQGQWWAETKKMFRGEVTIDDSTEVDDYVVSDPQAAGFVQVMQGQVSDPERARALMQQRPDDFAHIRPDILAILQLEHDDGRWTSVAYFSTEAEARERESQEPPPEFAAMMQEMASLSVSETRYYDLRQVWLDSPSTINTSSMAGGA